MVEMLAPIERVTRRISGATYPTLSLIHPYMEILKQSFAPRHDEGETINSYLDLIYGPLVSVEDQNLDDNEDSSVCSVSEDDIPSGGVRQHWQYAHRQFHQQM